MLVLFADATIRIGRSENDDTENKNKHDNANKTKDNNKNKDTKVEQQSISDKSISTEEKCNESNDKYGTTTDDAAVNFENVRFDSISAIERGKTVKGLIEQDGSGM